MTDLETLKAIDIVSVANRLGITFRRAGDNYSSICPFHSEKTPSFILFQATNSWRCFGQCQESGSNIDLIMKSQGSSFNTALEWIETNFGSIEESVEIEFKLSGETKKAFQHKPVRNDMLNYWHSALFHTGRHQMFVDRGFTLETIKKEGFGWSGDRYVIPVWYDEPWISQCIGVRLRASELLPETAFKYIGKKDHNKPCMYNRHTVKHSEYMFVFAGELDAKLCSQDGFPTISLVNGMTSFNAFPKNWCYLWFPSVRYILVVFDRKEAHVAGRLAAEWERQKGRNTACIIHWPIDIVSNFGYDDYNEFRLKNNSVETFLGICEIQMRGKEIDCLLPLSNMRN